VKESSPRYVTGAVEGLLDEAVLRRLVSEANGELVEVHGKRGKAHLASRLKAFNNAAQRDRWIVLMDLDDERDCPKFRRSMLQKPSVCMCFRIVCGKLKHGYWRTGNESQLFWLFPAARCHGIPSRS